MAEGLMKEFLCGALGLAASAAAVAAVQVKIENVPHNGCKVVFNDTPVSSRLASFLTAGPKESRAWTFRKGWKAPKCAGVIHTDFEKGFIRAQVVGYDDYVKYGGESGAREHGVLRPEGKEYEMKDGDVVEFMFN